MLNKQNIALFLLLVVFSFLAVGCGSAVSADVNGGQVVCENNVYLPVVNNGVGESVTPTPDISATSTVPPVRYCVTPTVPPTQTIPPVPTEAP